MKHIRRRDQFAALAFLRWRLFANSFRGKGTASDAVVRLIVYPAIGFLAVLPIAAAGFTAWYAVRTHHPGALAIVTWGVFALSALLSFNLGQAKLAFDPSSLSRYPLSFSSYVATRLFLGALSASNVVCALSLIAATLAIALARPALAPIAALSFGLYALALMVFTRMAFAWVDRWLATRRTREILTGLVFLFGIAAQFINFYVAGDSSHRRLQSLTQRFHFMQHLPQIVDFIRKFHWVSNYLPPGLAAAAVSSSIPSHHTPAFTGNALAFLLGIVLFGSICVCVFSLRMLREFRGENLTQADAAPVAVPSADDDSFNHERRAHPRPDLPTDSTAIAGRGQVVFACVRKELIYLRRGSPILFLLLSPLVMVYFFASRMGAMPNMTPLIFPAAVAYSLLGVSGGSYNVFGPDLNGTQLYLLAPVRLRDILFAKNLIGFITLGLQVCLTWVIVAFALTAPSASTTVTTLLWVVFAVSVNTCIANHRSVTAPTRVKSSGKQARPVSSFMSLGVMLACALLGATVFAIGFYLGQPWLPPAILSVLALAGVSTYHASLHLLETTALNHRETLSKELCKV